MLKTIENEEDYDTEGTTVRENEVLFCLNESSL